MSHSSEADKFNAFRELSTVQKKRLLSYCTALSYQATSDIDSVVSESTDFALNTLWTPTTENYFKRLKACDLLAIAKDNIGEQWTDSRAKLPKAKLVEQLAAHEEMADWIPESMR